MGYCIHIREQKFGILAKNIDAALEAVYQAEPTYPEQESIESIKKEIEDYEFLPAISKLKKIVNEAWGFQFKSDDKGNVIGVSQNCEKMRDGTFNWLKAIAHLVPAGCYIEMGGEDDAIWRYVFTGTGFEEKQPKIVWE